MGLDVRLPIGLLFTVIGFALAAYGLVSDPAIYERSLGFNVNLLWGSVLLVFGVIMLALARSAVFLQRVSPDAERNEPVAR
jgi:multisubunit Na+/H+ antiporter MnhG subunit